MEVYGYEFVEDEHKEVIALKGDDEELMMARAFALAKTHSYVAAITQDGETIYMTRNAALFE